MEVSPSCRHLGFQNAPEVGKEILGSSFRPKVPSLPQLKEIPMLSLSFPTIQVRNFALEESLGFLPAGTPCDHQSRVYLGSG